MDNLNECPYGIGHVCEHAVAGSKDGRYVPCIHLAECLHTRAFFVAIPKGEKDEINK